jgi:hypothetical protein
MSTESPARSPRIWSYGEDPLTLWVLSQRLGEFLARVEDGSGESDVLVLYRPSFGRGGRGRGEGEKPASFGEFDGIVATPVAVYLIESKWDGSPELRGDVLEIKPGQVLRHDVFRWYRNRWREDWPSWEAFEADASEDFADRFADLRFAPAGSRLAANIEFVLVALRAFGEATKDVALYCSRPRPAKELPQRVDPDHFTLATIEYEPLQAGTLYFELSGRLAVD